jgi:hypothetical protein
MKEEEVIEHTLHEERDLSQKLHAILRKGGRVTKIQIMESSVEIGR